MHYYSDHFWTLNIEDTTSIMGNNALGPKALVFYPIDLMQYCSYNALGISISIKLPTAKEGRKVILS